MSSPQNTQKAHASDLSGIHPILKSLLIQRCCV